MQCWVVYGLNSWAYVERLRARSMQVSKNRSPWMAISTHQGKKQVVENTYPPNDPQVMIK